MYSGVSSGHPGGTLQCLNITLPGTAYKTTPIATPLLNNVGYSMYGTNIFGKVMMEFGLGA